MAEAFGNEAAQEAAEVTPISFGAKFIQHNAICCGLRFDTSKKNPELKKFVENCAILATAIYAPKIDLNSNTVYTGRTDDEIFQVSGGPGVGIDRKRYAEGSAIISQNDLDNLGRWIERIFNVKMKTDDLAKGISTAAYDAAFSPVRDFFNSVKGKWDGVPRLKNVMHDFLNAEPISFYRHKIGPDGRYTNELDTSTQYDYATETLLINMKGIWERAFCAKDNPEKFDLMTILIGREGLGKSRFIEQLLGKQFYTCGVSFDDCLDQKVVGEKIRGFPIAEIPEIVFSKNPKDYHRFKGFLTQDFDHYRPAYAVNAEKFPRRTVFWATTNNMSGSILPDDTGTRRFLMLRLRDERPAKSVFTDMPNEVFQWWAEFVDSGLINRVRTYLDDDDVMFAVAKGLATENLMTDSKEFGIAKVLSAPRPGDWYSRSELARQMYLDNATVEDLRGNKLRPDKVCYREIVREVFGESWKNTKISKEKIKLDMKKLGCVCHEGTKERHSFGIYGQDTLWWDIPAQLYKKGQVFEFREEDWPSSPYSANNICNEIAKSEADSELLLKAEELLAALQISIKEKGGITKELAEQLKNYDYQTIAGLFM